MRTACEIPACRMASSGVGMFGDGVLERFVAWFSQLAREPNPRDYLFCDDTGCHWLYRLDAGQQVPEPFQVVDFSGELYAVAMDIDQCTDMDAMNAQVDAFLANHGLARDPSRKELGNIITSPAARAILGYDQMDYYTPMRPKGVANS